MQKILFGQSIESLVCTFLSQHGLELVEKNFYCRLGEIDLIMFEPASNTLVFIEVRFRRTGFHGNATESVDWKKQRKLKRTVLHYLQKQADVTQAARIDVVGVSSKDNDEQQHYPFKVPGISIHQLDEYQLVWTQNAITE